MCSKASEEICEKIVEILTESDYALVGVDDPIYVQVNVAASEARREELSQDRAPYNLSIVIDRSGSMSGKANESSK